MTRIGEALERGEIVPHFQPLIDLETNCLVGFEALARWNDPARGVVEPAGFIEDLQRLGFMTELTQSLLLQACKAAVRWAAPINVAVNISPAEFCDDGLVERIRIITEETGLPPQRLFLEMTESAAVDNLGRVRDNMLELKALGVHLALDDFGVGYSNLDKLHRLPVDKVKVDMSFVRVVQSDWRSRSIMSAIVDLARRLGLRVVAEGVETPLQARILHDMGCHVGQGWLFGRPLCGSAAAELAQYARRAGRVASASAVLADDSAGRSRVGPQERHSVVKFAILDGPDERSAAGELAQPLNSFPIAVVSHLASHSEPASLAEAAQA